jgi:AcrR family transcriptional regulator
MGRRSTHSPDELRELILRATEDLVERSGLTGLSAREIARAIGYSAGTLYNCFENLDDVILHVEARVLDRLERELAAVHRTGTPEDHVRRLALRYLSFTSQQPKLWNLLFEHHLPDSMVVPAWYQEKLDALLARVEEAVRPLVVKPRAVKRPAVQTEAANSDGVKPAPVEVQRAARVLWAGVHGITSLATAEKLSSVTHETAQVLVDDLVTHYLAGMRALAT